MECKKKYNYKKTPIDDPNLVKDMNNSISGMLGKCPAVRRRGCKK